MKHIKKIAALVLAIAMILSLSSVAFAAVDSEVGSYEGSNNTGYGVVSGAVKITKTVVIFNPTDDTQVREPNLTFVYSVSPVTDAAQLGTITDDGRNNPVGNPAVNTPVTVQVNAGVAGVVSDATIEFNNTVTQAAKNKGAAISHDGSFTINLAAGGTAGVDGITHAGVYRYLITESIKDTGTNNVVPAADLPKYGLEARTAEYDTTRYLDLYVANGTSGLEVSSAVIFKVNSKDDSNTAGKDAVTTTTDKTTGFEPGIDHSTTGGADYTNDTEVDRYFTYNLKVGKTTKGSLADLTHDFPFVITLTADSNLVPEITADLTVTGATNLNDGTRTIKAGDAHKVILEPKMSNGDYIELKGLPKGTTVTVKETNDTVDQYTASWDTTQGTTTTATVNGYTTANVLKGDLALKAGANDYAKTDNEIAIDGNQTTEYKDTVLGFTNTLSEISPTGYVVRIAPYVLMLAGGVALLVVTRRRREDAQAA